VINRDWYKSNRELVQTMSSGVDMVLENDDLSVQIGVGEW